jgi:hypothetical protein
LKYADSIDYSEQAEEVHFNIQVIWGRVVVHALYI